MPGRLPDPNARRTNDKSGWRTLPPSCDRPAPRWPLKGRKPAGLVELWRHLWSLPVAEVWHEQNAVRVVARYALVTLQIESAFAFDSEVKVGHVIAEFAAELRQIEDRLLISPSHRLRARVLIDETPQAAPVQHEGNVTSIDEYRDLDVG